MKKFLMETCPYEQFRVFQKILDQANVDNVGKMSMVLSTAGKSGMVSSRTVMCREFDDNGFKFYTNYESRKGKDLYENPNASVCFYWHCIKTQVSMRGICEKLSDTESNVFYSKLPRVSQVIPHVSKQSRKMTSHEQFEDDIVKFTKEHEGKKLSCPSHWGGYLFRPSEFEFWRENPQHLISKSDRWKYTLKTSDHSSKPIWEINLLYP